MNNQILNRLSKEELEWIIKNPQSLQKAYEEMNKPPQPFKCEVNDCFKRVCNSFTEFYKVSYMSDKFVYFDTIEVNMMCKSIERYEGQEYDIFQIPKDLVKMDSIDYNIINKLCDNYDTIVNDLYTKLYIKIEPYLWDE